MLEISELNTGTIYFYNEKNRRLKTAYSHNEQVSEVAKILNEQISERL
ncbi:MAG: hypothetical protein ACTSRS_16325 [Candidatus Helarchaeota archaeon]